MPPKPAARRQSVGKAFQTVDESRSVGQKFQQKAGDKLPSVMLMDRFSLKLLRGLAEARGWPRGAKIGEALAHAQRGQALSIQPLIERFGAVELSRASFIVLPVLDGYGEADADRTFRAQKHGSTVVLYPPGSDITVVPPPQTIPSITLSILFFPFGGRQEEALAASEFEVLFGGAKGGAKTETMVAMAVRQIDRAAYKALVFRKTELALEEVVNRAKSMYEPLGGKYYVADKTFDFPSGAKIELGYCEVESDTDRYQGREFAFVGGDEIAQVADNKVRNRLISECRCPDPSVVRMVRFTANPIGPGVANLKRLFITPCGQDGARVHNEEYDIPGLGKVKLARRFIPSKVTDNPVYAKDPQYMATLHSLPDRMRRLLLHGDWSAALGVALDELSWAKHWVGLSDPRYPKDGEIPAHWPLYGYFDWGFSHRWCFVIIALDEQGVAWVVDTLWGQREDVPEIAGRIREWVGPEGRTPRPIWASKLCFADRSWQGQNVPTYASQFAKAHLPMIEANESPGTRITGLNNMRQWLAWQRAGPKGGEGEPRLLFLETHGNRILFLQLEAMVPDPDNPEDVLKVDYDSDASENGLNFSGDDGYDALKMFATMRPLAAKKPPVVVVANPNFDSSFDKRMAERERSLRRPSATRGF